jgi:dUTP pyrophosphatase
VPTDILSVWKLNHIQHKDNSVTQIGVFSIHPQAHLPSYATAQSACFDISACLIDGESIAAFSAYNSTVINNTVKDGKIVMQSGSRMLVPTGLVFDIPEGYSLRLHPRSGLAYKSGISLANCEGVIDSDYWHQTFVALINTSHCEFTIRHGDRIAQGEIVPLMPCSFHSLDEAPSQRTSRAGGFGSTGQNT